LKDIGGILQRWLFILEPILQYAFFIGMLVRKRLFRGVFGVMLLLGGKQSIRIQAIDWGSNNRLE